MRRKLFFDKSFLFCVRCRIFFYKRLVYKIFVVTGLIFFFRVLSLLFIGLKNLFVYNCRSLYLRLFVSFSTSCNISNPLVLIFILPYGRVRIMLSILICNWYSPQSLSCLLDLKSMWLPPLRFNILMKLFIKPSKKFLTCIYVKSVK